MGQQVNLLEQALLKCLMKILKLVPMIRPETKWSYYKQVIMTEWSSVVMGPNDLW